MRAEGSGGLVAPPSTLHPQPSTWQQFAAHAAGWGISLAPAQVAAFQQYLALLADWNRRFNLTRITAPEEIVAKHFLDSLACATVWDFRASQTLIDVGTGAGFPGLPLK